LFEALAIIFILFILFVKFFYEKRVKILQLINGIKICWRKISIRTQNLPTNAPILPTVEFKPPQFVQPSAPFSSQVLPLSVHVPTIYDPGLGIYKTN